MIPERITQFNSKSESCLKPEEQATPLSHGSILIVETEAGIRDFLSHALSKRWSLVKSAKKREEAENLWRRYRFDLVVLDIGENAEDGLDWARSMLEDHPSVLIFTSEQPDVDTVLEALRMGAADFHRKPFRMEQMLDCVESALMKLRENNEPAGFSAQTFEDCELAGMIGHSGTMQNLAGVIRRIAPTPSTVLLEGESGSGKEMAANAIHKLSGCTGPFVPIHCAAISPELLESELFGHSKGAFTGAHQAREGLFLYANEGTLFLDEIGEMPLHMQVKLLRFLEEGTIRPVGHNQEIPVNVRIIAATNRSLVEEVRAARFREDLFYRLNVVMVTMPPLRERPVDIPVLADYFSECLALKLNRDSLVFSDEEQQLLKNYQWPGNVRELKNVIERCMLLNLPLSQCIPAEQHHPEINPPAAETASTEDLSLKEVEKQHILTVLGKSGGNKSEASRHLGISRKTLDRKLQEWNTQV